MCLRVERQGYTGEAVYDVCQQSAAPPLATGLGVGDDSADAADARSCGRAVGDVGGQDAGVGPGAEIATELGPMGVGHRPWRPRMEHMQRLGQGVDAVGIEEQAVLL